jgi:pimeloyl-ACP methyl ester carboxylesterase
MYTLVHPQQVKGLAMIAPGPIPFEFLEVYQCNQLRPLTASERRQVQMLQEQSIAAQVAGDIETVRALYRQRMVLSFRAWFYDPELADQMLESWLASVDPYLVAQIEPYIFDSLASFAGWSQLAQVTMPTLILYGYQDFEPITQAYTLREWLPHAQLAWINRCGHWPWIEQPDEFYRVLEPFLLSQQR